MKEQSNKNKLQDWFDIDQQIKRGKDVNAIDKFLHENEPAGIEDAALFRSMFLDALQYECKNT